MALVWLGPVNPLGSATYFLGAVPFVDVGNLSQDNDLFGYFNKNTSVATLQNSDRFGMTTFGDPFDSTPEIVWTSPYGGDAIVSIKVEVEYQVTTSSGLNTLFVSPYTGSHAANGNFMSADLNSLAWAWTSFEQSPAEWGITKLAVENIALALSNWGVMFKAEFDLSSVIRALRIRRVKLSYLWDTLWAPPTSGSAILLGSF